MNWKQAVAEEPRRSRILLATMLLGVMVALPIPVYGKIGSVSLSLTLLWASLMLLTYSLFFKAQWLWGAAMSSALLCFVYSLVSGFWMILLLLFMCLLWARRRNERFPFFAYLILLMAPAVNGASMQNALIPGFQEYRLDDLASCGNLDKIPWEFLPDKRQTRKLFAEEMRFSSDESSFWWELHQVMKPNGEVTFVFRRKLPNGDYVSYAARDFEYSEVHSSPKRSKTVATRNLKHLINRPALIFYRADGSVVNYLPGSLGKSTIMIQFAQSTGAYLPPVYIRGNFCDRPASLSESDTTDSSFGKVKNQGSTKSEKDALK